VLWPECHPADARMEGVGFYGIIFEWDSQHGAVEMYDKQGKHLGEFDPITGEQSKPAKTGRKVEK